MRSPFLEPVLKDVILSLNDDEVVVVDGPTKLEIESEGFTHDLRFPLTNNGMARSVAYLGRERAAVRARRLHEGSRPTVVTPENLSGLSRAPLLVVAMSDRELIQSVAVARRAPGARVLSLKNEIHPAVTAQGDLDIKIERLLRRYEGNARSLVLLAVMRSGSYFLAELATLLGLGHPEEHIKDPIVDALGTFPRHDLSFRVWLGSLMTAHRESGSGWFGTKIISHYLIRLRENLHESERAWLDEWLASAWLVTLHREDHVEQAVSAYRAQQTGVYRARNQHEQERAALEIPYDFESLRERLEFVRRENRFIREYAAGADPSRHLGLTYESFTDDVPGTIRSLAAFTDVDVVMPERLENRPLTSQESQDMIERFRGDLAGAEDSPKEGSSMEAGVAGVEPSYD